jgi:phage repressor protein C with HTH and peptisase S24 domain
MHERLKKARKHAGLTQEKFGEKLGLKQTQVRDIESGKQKVSAELAELMEKNFYISGWWLLTGKGEMIPSESKNLPVAQNEPHNNDEVSVNYYPDIFAAAGYGATNGDSAPEIMTVSRSFLFNMFGLTSFVGIDIIHVVGDSMEPFIPNGETILLQRTHEARNNQVVIARIGGDIFVKRLLRDPLGRWAKLVSDNSLYPDIDLNQEEMQQLEIIGIVYGRYRPIS